MNRLISHIEFLLHEHNCVIIPDLGGFVVNTIHSKSDGLAMFYPPVSELVFNRELTYNDGLLAESYMGVYDLTFEAAMWKINEDVSLIKQQLRDSQNVDLGKLGSFSIINNVFTYKPGSFERPAYFGLTRSKLMPLMQIQSPVVNSKKVVVKQRRLRTSEIAVVAAVFLALMMFVMPMSDKAINRQSAKISYGTEWLKSKNKSDVSGQLAKDSDVDVVAASVDSSALVETVAPTASNVEEIAEEDLPRYYIVMGVFEINSGAERLVGVLKDKGLTDTGLIKRPGRYDVYAASFVNEESAKEYLKEIHKQFPTHSDAWILKR